MKPGDSPTPSNAPPPRGPWRESSNLDYWLLTQSQPDWLHPFELLGVVSSFAEFRALMTACTDYLSKDAARGNSTPDRILRSERFRVCGSMNEAGFQVELESWRWHRKDWYVLKQVIEGACADGVLTIGERDYILERSRACGFADQEVLDWIKITWPDLQPPSSQSGGRIERRVEGLLDEAERLETARDYVGAIAAYDEVLALIPGHSEATALRESVRRRSSAPALPILPSATIVPASDPSLPGASPSRTMPPPAVKPPDSPIPESILSRTRLAPTAVGERSLTLRERGVLLQKVHFSQYMNGYDLYLSGDGKLGPAVTDPAATFEVRNNRVCFVAHARDVILGRMRLPPEKMVPLLGDCEINVGGVIFEYRDLTAIPAEGWPYLGEIRRIATSIDLAFASVYRIGRDRECRIRLPDVSRNDNIIWRPECSKGDVIRARTGEIPKSRFYSDSIMVASEAAEVDLTNEPVLRSLARHCYTYVRRGMDVVALFPTRKEEGVYQTNLLPGDEILVGNSIFEVSYPMRATPTMAESSPSSPRGLFLYREGTPEEQIYPMTNDILTFGRARDNDIQIKNDSKVSRYHCRAYRRSDGYYIEDNKSSNGILVGGELITERRLLGGEEIIVGETFFRFR